MNPCGFCLNLLFSYGLRTNYIDLLTNQAEIYYIKKMEGVYNKIATYIMQ